MKSKSSRRVVNVQPSNTDVSTPDGRLQVPQIPLQVPLSIFSGDGDRSRGSRGGMPTQTQLRRLLWLWMSGNGGGMVATPSVRRHGNSVGSIRSEEAEAGFRPSWYACQHFCAERTKTASRFITLILPLRRKVQHKRYKRIYFC